MNTLETILQKAAIQPTQHGLRFSVVRITPDTAQRLLDEPTTQPSAAGITNRVVIKRNVERLAASMERGQWRLNGEPLIFDADGARLNGEHRLRAVVKSGVPIVTAVVSGVKNETFTTMDTGAPRGRKDIQHIVGHANSTIRSAVLMWLFAYDRGVHGSVSNLHAAARGSLLTNDEMLAYDAMQGDALADGAAFAQAMKKRLQLLRPSVVGAVYCLAQQSTLPTEVGEEFWNSLQTLAGLPDGSPILTLHRALANAKTSRDRPPRDWEIQMVVRAFNYHAEQRLARIIRYQPGQPIPELIGRPRMLVTDEQYDAAFALTTV